MKEQASPNLSILRQALERGTKHSPRLSELLITIWDSENVEQRYKDDVVVMEVGFAMQYRPFSVIATASNAKQEARRRDKKDEPFQEIKKYTIDYKF